MMTTDDRASQFAVTLLAALPLDWLLDEVRRRRMPAGLAAGTDAEFVAEAEGRGYRVYRTDDDIELPGLVISPVQRAIHFRGCWHHLSRREVDVVGRIARAHPRPIPRPYIEQSIWGTREGKNTHYHLRAIQRRVPGLIQEAGPAAGFRSAVGLDINDGRQPAATAHLAFWLV